MKKINYTLDKNNIIIGWCRVPFDETKPFIEVDDNIEIHDGFDKIIDGKLVIDKIGYEAASKKTVEKIKILNKINELKKLLAESDYQAIKYAEGELTLEEYTPMKIKRQEWRLEINKLEQE